MLPRPVEPRRQTETVTVGGGSKTADFRF